jgi:hypothetical protein
MSVSLPAGFAADPSYAPVWLQQDAEIGVAGNADGKSVMIGLSGPDYRNQRILAEDLGPGAPHGKLLDVAASPDGLALASVVTEPAQNRVEVMLRNMLGAGDSYSLATIDGAFENAQLTWIDAFTLVLVLRSVLPNVPGALGIESSRSGFYVINANNPPGIRQLRGITCRGRQLSFSPSEHMAVSAGDFDEPVVLINLDNETCRTLGVPQPFQVLAWAPDSSALLYSTLGKNSLPGIFQYDIAGESNSVVAISSGSAAYASDGTIIALGNESLAWTQAAASPDKPVNLQVSLRRAGGQEININPIGVATTATLLARSRMIFSRVSDRGLIDVVALSGDGPRRELIEYSYRSRATFGLADCLLDAPLAISWSPDGNLIAVLDSGARPNLLTVIAPPSLPFTSAATKNGRKK